MATGVSWVERTGHSYKFGVTGDPLLEGGNGIATNAREVPALPAKLRAAIVTLFKTGLLKTFQVTDNGRQIQLWPRNMDEKGRLDFAERLARLSGKWFGCRPPDVNHVPSSLATSLKRLLK